MFDDRESLLFSQDPEELEAHPHTTATTKYGFGRSHFYYILVMMCILPSIFNMILNGGIGAIMYHSKDTVPIWGGPKSVGGDVILMTAIMSMFTWIFSGAFATR